MPCSLNDHSFATSLERLFREPSHVRFGPVVPPASATAMSLTLKGVLLPNAATCSALRASIRLWQTTTRPDSFARCKRPRA